MIYTTIVIPLVIYCGTVNLNLSRTSLGKLGQIHERAVGIITKTNPVTFTPIMNYVKRNACQMVTSITRQLPAPMTIPNYCHTQSQQGKIQSRDSIIKSQNNRSPKWISLSRCNDLLFLNKRYSHARKLKCIFKKIT